MPQKVEGPHCGNGFLEDGEECDCGPDEFCHNKCCIAAACKLSVNGNMLTESSGEEVVMY